MQLAPGRVTAIATPYVAVDAYYRGQPYQKLCRPILCGVTTGLHWMPKLGDRVWIAYIESALPTVLCGLSNFDLQATSKLIPLLPNVLPGETWILAPPEMCCVP